MEYIGWLMLLLAIYLTLRKVNTRLESSLAKAPNKLESQAVYRVIDKFPWTLRFMVQVCELIVTNPLLRPRDGGYMQFMFATMLMSVSLSGQRPEKSAEYIERAIEHYDKVRTTYSSHTAPEPTLWFLTVVVLLPLAYIIRIRGDRAENIERAIELLKEGQNFCPRDTNPQAYASLVNSLAGAYRMRIRGNRLENLDQSISYYHQISEIVQPQTRSYEANQILLGLALAHTELASVQREHHHPNADVNLHRAIAFFEEALEVFTRHDRPMEWAGAILNLGDCYRYRTHGERVPNLHRAIRCYEQALEVWTQKAYPFWWAKLQVSLADTHSILSHEDCTVPVEKAVSFYKAALDVYTPTTFSRECRDTAYKLGRLFYEKGDFASARSEFEKAHKAVQQIRGEVRREAAKRDISKDNAELYAHLVTCCLKQNDTAAAFEYAAAGKGRAFVDLLASAEVRLDPATLGADDPELAHQLQQANELSQEIEILQMRLNRDNIPQHMIAIYDITKYTELPLKKVQDRIDQLVAEEDELWEELSFRYPSIASTERVPAITATDAKMFAKELDVTLVEYYRHATGWSAFVITPDKIWHVALPHINDAVIKRVSNWIEIPYSNIYSNQLDELHLLYQTAIAPLLPNLPSGSNLVLAPFGKLHLLPLAAALNPINNRFVYEDYILTLVPSVSALYTVRQEVNKRAQNHQELAWYESMLSVAYPGVQGNARYLKNATLEAQVVAESFAGKTKPLLYDEATCAAVIEQARNYDLLHLSCHGSAYPQRSGLILADGSLTIQRIVNELRLKNPKLVTMGACGSGKARIHQGDELLGLVQAMMTIGAPTVVASLWDVDDAATCELFSQFYSHLRSEGSSPAVAMRSAIDAVRSHSEWQHPFFWAAFTVNGLAFIKTTTRSRRIPSAT